ncbi:MAG: 5-formyltetrahydrofolate cyclo-ligase [Desulfuromonadaceae bacterium]|nr:5-formyltetrahydrofolate cyclo-ligase [Desulfuromonadaceae bacterium]
MPKRSLRSQLLADRRALSQTAWLVSSLAAQRNLLSLQEYSRAGCIALYAAVHQEVDTSGILTDAFESGKRVLYPALCGKEMVFRQVLGLDRLQEGAFGILEPCPTGVEHQADEADLIVVPGVAFDLSGHRIGYGKGYYDRFLKHPGRKAHLVGLCHDFQLIDGDIPADRHDIRMEIIITDRRIIYVKEVTGVAHSTRIHI